MPQIGDIKSAREIGKRGMGQKGEWSKYIYIACPDCEKTRWVRRLRGNPETIYCYDCAIKRVGLKQRGRGNPLWRGGKYKSSGYIMMILPPEDEFFRPMAGSRGRVQGHRLIMAKHLNRCLLPWEIVHHRNGIRDDNRIENLELLSARKYHIIDTQVKAENKRLHKRLGHLEGRVIILEAEIVALKADGIGVEE